MNEAVVLADPAVVPFVQSLLADEVKVAAGKAYLVRGSQVSVAGSTPVQVAPALPEGAEDVVNNNRMRRELEGALAALSLFAPDRVLRVKAIQELKEQADTSRLPLLQKALAAEYPSLVGCAGSAGLG